MENTKFSLQIPLDQIEYLQSFGNVPTVNYAKHIYDGLGVKGHIGIDVNMGEGCPLYSVCDGTVVYMNDVTPDAIVILTDPDDSGICLEITYAHGQNSKVIKGHRVKKGDEICEQGHTGPTTLGGPLQTLAWSHLHFAVRQAKLIDASTPMPPLKWGYNAYSPIRYNPLNTDNGYEGHIDPTPYFEQVINRVGDAIIRMEGMKLGNNPYALRDSQFQTGTIAVAGKGTFSTFATLANGEAAGMYILNLDASGRSKIYSPGMTMLDFISIRSPKSDGNDPVNYTNRIHEWEGIGAQTIIGDWLLDEMEWCKKYSNAESLVYPQPELVQLSDGVKGLWSTFWQLVRSGKLK